ncbi:MAG: lysophospholipid acyltransferase family protein [Pseudomonadota bacterium]
MLQTSLEAARARAAGGRRHIVDQLIEERARHLIQEPLLWPLIRTFVYPLLQYRQAIAMADEVGGESGVAVLDHLSNLLDLRLDASGLDLIPREGPLIFVANHPTGIADGIAVYDALKSVRPDMIFFANRDAIRVAPRLDEVLIPVEWVAENRTPARSRETLKASVDALKAGRAVILFPSGRIARREGGRLHEQPWLTTPISLARKYDAPIVPMHVSARNSFLYYFLWKVSPELRDMTLFHELLNKRRKRFGISIGSPIQTPALEGDSEAVIGRLQAYVEHDLPAGRREFPSLAQASGPCAA